MQFGKRRKETIEGRLLSSKRNHTSTTDADLKTENKTKIIIDYILSQTENDNRPYLQVDILGTDILGLLDSGSSRSILGQKGWNIFRDLGLHIETKQTKCTVANGQTCPVLGVVHLPVKLLDKTCIIEFLVVPDLPHLLILGLDFWKIMGIVPDLRKGKWIFSKDTQNSFTDTVHLQDENFLTPNQQLQLKEVIEATSDNGTNELGCTNLVYHKIVTNSAPIKSRYYPVNPIIQSHMDKAIEDMLNKGIIEKSNSPWSSPVVLVKKKDNTYRFCVDYRKLNSVTEKDAYAIPYVTHTLDKLRNSRYLSSIDIKSAYWQVPMHPDSKKFTAFTVPNRGLYQFCRMPMGLHNSAATWQRLIDSIIGPTLEPYAFAYLDDIVICTDDFEKHVDILREVFKRLKQAGLTVNKEKCAFCRPSLKYLGYIVDGNGLHVDPEKVEAILNLPTPKNTKEVRRIVGMTSWYRRFVPNFSAIVTPITDLLKKNKKFCWSEECEEAFSKLKQQLVSAPVTHGPDYKLPFVLQTDASGYGIGAVLYQPISDKEVRVICYISRSLTRLERNYATTHRECLAVLWAIEKLRPYLEGITFTVVTDHHSLVWLQNLKDPTGRLARWSIRLQQYSFNIVHRKGKDLVIPDLLSRSVPMIDAITAEDTKPPDDRWYNKMMNRVREKSEQFPGWTIINNKLYKRIKANLTSLADQEDFWREVVPKEDRLNIIKQHHDHPTAGHAGIFKTHGRIQQRYYWPKMKTDISKYIQKCKICLQSKPEQKAPAGYMLPRSITDKPWKTVAMDLIGPLPTSKHGNRFILVVVDVFSKFPLIFPLRNSLAHNVVNKFIDHVIMFFGSPKTIECDNGVQFKSKQFTDMAKEYGITIKFNPNFHPNANPSERTNRVLKTMIASYCYENHKEWDVRLSSVACAIRNNKHESTNYTPYFLNFGREIILFGKEHEKKEVVKEALQTNNRENDDIDSTNEVYNKWHDKIVKLNEIFKIVKDRLRKAYEKQKTYYNLRKRPYEFEVGQLVWKRNYVLSDASKYFSAKLAPKYVGPLTIKKKISPWTYELVDDKGVHKGVWHAKDLKPQPE